MKRVAVFCALSLSLVGCGGGGSTTASSNTAPTPQYFAAGGSWEFTATSNVDGGAFPACGTLCGEYIEINVAQNSNQVTLAALPVATPNLPGSDNFLILNAQRNDVDSGCFALEFPSSSDNLSLTLSQVNSGNEPFTGTWVQNDPNGFNAPITFMLNGNFTDNGKLAVGTYSGGQNTFCQDSGGITGYLAPYPTGTWSGQLSGLGQVSVNITTNTSQANQGIVTVQANGTDLYGPLQCSGNQVGGTFWLTCSDANGVSQYTANYADITTFKAITVQEVSVMVNVLGTLQQ